MKTKRKLYDYSAEIVVLNKIRKKIPVVIVKCIVTKEKSNLIR